MNNNFAKKTGKYFLFGLIIALSIVLADQYSKWLVIETVLRIKAEQPDFIKWMITENKIPTFEIDREVFKTIAVTPFLNFTMVWNQGVSFGLFDSSNPTVAYVFIAISLLAALLLTIWMALCASRLVAASLGLVAGGAIANAMDRVRFGAVADFIDVYVKGWHWPAFNLADSAIVLGAILMMYDTLFRADKRGAK